MSAICLGIAYWGRAANTLLYYNKPYLPSKNLAKNQLAVDPVICNIAYVV